MKKHTLIAYIFLILLTLSTAILSQEKEYVKNLSMGILAISIVKFFIVAFEFMEMRKAHTLWKVIVVFTGLLFFIVMTAYLP
jgi:hypothetical protein